MKKTITIASLLLAALFFVARTTPKLEPPTTPIDMAGFQSPPTVSPAVKQRRHFEPSLTKVDATTPIPDDVENKPLLRDEPFCITNAAQVLMPDGTALHVYRLQDRGAAGRRVYTYAAYQTEADKAASKFNGAAITSTNLDDQFEAAVLVNFMGEEFFIMKQTVDPTLPGVTYDERDNWVGIEPGKPRYRGVLFDSDDNPHVADVFFCARSADTVEQVQQQLAGGDEWTPYDIGAGTGGVPFDRHVIPGVSVTPIISSNH